MDAPASKPADGQPRATVRRVSWPGDLDIVRRLFQEYRGWLADHQDPASASVSKVGAGLALIDRLIVELPGAYGPPGGDILLWLEDDRVVACGALREIEPRVGELKRIYVRSDYRGKAFGIPFVQAILRRARQLGYQKLKVDTLPSMAAAIEFYQKSGFRPTAPFWPHPVAGALFFEREIRD